MPERSHNPNKYRSCIPSSIMLSKPNLSKSYMQSCWTVHLSSHMGQKHAQAESISAKFQCSNIRILTKVIHSYQLWTTPNARTYSIQTKYWTILTFLRKISTTQREQYLHELYQNKNLEKDETYTQDPCWWYHIAQCLQPSQDQSTYHW